MKGKLGLFAVSSYSREANTFSNWPSLTVPPLYFYPRLNTPPRDRAKWPHFHRLFLSRSSVSFLIKPFPARAGILWSRRQKNFWILRVALINIPHSFRTFVLSLVPPPNPPLFLSTSAGNFPRGKLLETKKSCASFEL